MTGSMACREVQLGEVVDFRAGIGFPLALQGRPAGDVPFAKVGDISRHGRNGFKYIESADHFISTSDLTALRSRPIPPGSTLFAKIGEAIRHNHRVISSRPLLIDNNAMAATPHDGLDPGYLYRFLQTIDFYPLAATTTVPSLRKSDLERIAIWLPSLSEQKRIASILDLADALRANDVAISVLNAKLAQTTFLDTFGDPIRNPMGWPSGTLGEYSERVTDGEHKTPRRSESGIPLLSARSIQRGWVDFQATDFVSDEVYELLSRRIEPRIGDILISCSGTIGRVARVRTEAKFAMVRSVALVRPDPRMSPGYLEALLSTPQMNALMNGRANSSAQANLFQNQIRDLPVIVPPIAQQKALEKNIQAAEKQSVLVRTRSRPLNALFASLQARAFSGLL